MRKPDFPQGVKDGIPICLGYISVSFAFGIFAVGSGLGIWDTVLLSMTNLTSAGQFAAVPVMVAGGSLLELIFMQITINIRYALMSLSLSQNLAEGTGLRARFMFSYGITDEIFAMTAGHSLVTDRYMYGLILMPFIGWTAGTLLGAAAGSILPKMLVSALGIAIYGMFVAIVVPPAKKSRPIAFCALMAVFLRCLFYFVPALSAVPDGFSVIICAVVSSALCALSAPASEGEGPENA